MNLFACMVHVCGFVLEYISMKRPVTGATNKHYIGNAQITVQMTSHLSNQSPWQLHVGVAHVAFKVCVAGL